MNFGACKLKCGLAAAIATGMIFSARADEGVIFSKPENPVVNPDSETKPQIGGADHFSTPSAFDSDSTLGAPLPMPVPQNNSLQEEINARKNWTLLTPAEILGVPTPEKIMGVENWKEQDTSLEERFLLRQQKAANAAATNNMNRSDAAIPREDSPQNPFLDFNDKKKSAWDDVPASDSTKYLNQFLNSGTPATDNQNPQSPWSDRFDSPAPLIKPNLDQIAEMQRFRALIDSAPAMVTTPTAISTFSSPARNPDLESPLENPLGHSFKPLQSDIFKPSGAAPLPTLIRAETPVKKTKAELESQLPPWMRDGPQPGLPQRKF